MYDADAVAGVLYNCVAYDGNYSFSEWFERRYDVIPRLWPHCSNDALRFHVRVGKSTPFGVALEHRECLASTCATLCRVRSLRLCVDGGDPLLPRQHLCSSKLGDCDYFRPTRALHLFCWASDISNRTASI